MEQFHQPKVVVEHSLRTKARKYNVQINDFIPEEEFVDESRRTRLPSSQLFTKTPEPPNLPVEEDTKKLTRFSRVLSRNQLKDLSQFKNATASSIKPVVKEKKPKIREISTRLLSRYQETDLEKFKHKILTRFNSKTPFSSKKKPKKLRDPLVLPSINKKSATPVSLMEKQLQNRIVSKSLRLQRMFRKYKCEI